TSQAYKLKAEQIGERGLQIGRTAEAIKIDVDFLLKISRDLDEVAEKINKARRSQNVSQL
ncbi:MAG: hypothetical protein KAR06_03345, partial [Deltaproteobacteria bacterium]|nr:hypothetical protein [Deltaproteobacteria bacterium]